jgi:tetratricopeptide (TPR) repeat protein
VIRRFLTEHRWAPVIATALCFWALYAQQHFRIAAGTPAWAIAWAGVTLTILAAGLTVRRWVRRRLAPSHEALVVLDYAAMAAYLLIGLYALWSLVLLLNATLDSSPADAKRATVARLTRGEAYFNRFVPLAWAELAFESGERRSALLTAEEADALWGGQIVEVTLHAGGAGLQRIEAIARDEEAGHRAVLAVSPDAAASWAGLLRIYARRQAWPQVMETAKAYLRTSNDVDPVSVVAAERFQRRDYKRAAELYRLAFERDKSFNGYLLLGWTLANLGQFDEGLPLLRKAVELNSETFWGYYHLAYAYKYAGKKTEAAAAFREVLRRRPDYPEIEQELRSLGL